MEGTCAAARVSGEGKWSTRFDIWWDGCASRRRGAQERMEWLGSAGGPYAGRGAAARAVAVRVGVEAHLRCRRRLLRLVVRVRHLHLLVLEARRRLQNDNREWSECARFEPRGGFEGWKSPGLGWASERTGDVGERTRTGRPVSWHGKAPALRMPTDLRARRPGSAAARARRLRPRPVTPPSPQTHVRTARAPARGPPRTVALPLRQGAQAPETQRGEAACHANEDANPKSGFERPWGLGRRTHLPRASACGRVPMDEIDLPRFATLLAKPHRYGPAPNLKKVTLATTHGAWRSEPSCP